MGMIPNSYAFEVFGVGSRSASPVLLVAGTPRPSVYDAAAVAAVKPLTPVTWGMPHRPAVWSEAFKLQPGIAGFYATDQVFPGLG